MDAGSKSVAVRRGQKTKFRVHFGIPGGFWFPMRWILLCISVCLSLNNLSAYDLSIAAVFRNEGAYLQEWIEYHKMVGVEHFWLYNDSSEDDWEIILEPYIAEGTVEVAQWPIPVPNQREIFQLLAYKDALNKAKGITQWLAIIDLDEYLIPMQEKTITECLKRHFTKASAIYVNWRCFGTGGLTLKLKESCLFRLTACCEPFHPTTANGKSIVRPECVEEEKLWYVHHCPLKKDRRYYNGDGNEIPVSDIEPKLDGQSHTKHLRINHYTMRDEYFFHNIRLQRNRDVNVPESFTWEHYSAFNRDHDETIIHFIREKHPDMYEKYWKRRTSID
jgi:hypothetical protein